MTDQKDSGIRRLMQQQKALEFAADLEHHLTADAAVPVSGLGNAAHFSPSCELHNCLCMCACRIVSSLEQLLDPIAHAVVSVDYAALLCSLQAAVRLRHQRLGRKRLYSLQWSPMDMTQTITFSRTPLR